MLTPCSWQNPTKKNKVVVTSQTKTSFTGALALASNKPKKTGVGGSKFSSISKTNSLFPDRDKRRDEAGGRKENRPVLAPPKYKVASKQAKDLNAYFK